jgi:DNA-binding CsgD family transcriptional regulator
LAAVADRAVPVEKHLQDNADVWQQFAAVLRRPEFEPLHIDCVAVGRSSSLARSVQIQDILFVDGELHEDPHTLRSHCASLVAVWSAVREPSLLDLGDCTCVGRRVLFGEPRLGRRFAIHALPLGADAAIFTVLTSTSTWSGDLPRRLVGELASEASNIYARLHQKAAAPALARTVAGPDWYVFTQREVDILRLLAQGMSNKQIARELGSSPNTVRNQVHAVFRKAGAVNRTELALRATALIENRAIAA